MTSQKTWTQKLHDSKDLPKVVKLNANGALHWHGETMVVPSPMEVDKVIAKVPKGKIINIDGIRQKLAKKFKTDIACPLTTGIFSWIVANAAQEQLSQGVAKTKISPWWRVVKSDNSLNPKFPGGGVLQKKLLEAEGQTIIQKRSRYIVL